MIYFLLGPEYRPTGDNCAGCYAHTAAEAERFQPVIGIRTRINTSRIVQAGLSSPFFPHRPAAPSPSRK